MTPVHDLLAAIVACARTSVAWRRERVPLAELERQGRDRAPRGDLFVERLARRDSVNVIAECKRRSPAKGILVRDYRPEVIARGYADGGAAAVSVLTEPTCFDGCLEHLAAVRGAVDVPLLRKDFIIDVYQLHEARAFGADAVLLIAAAVGQPELVALLRDAEALGLAALVEVHDRDELARAADAGARAVGVNCRDLRTLVVDTRTFDALAPCAPAGAAFVAESGLTSASDVRRLRAAGYTAFLIGEWFMRSQAPGATLAALIREAS